MNAFTKGQAVNVIGHKTVCYFVKYLPVATWTNKAKPRAVVVFGENGGEMEFFVSELTEAAPRKSTGLTQQDFAAMGSDAERRAAWEAEILAEMQDDIEAAHAEALEINALVDEAVKVSICYCDIDNLNHASILLSVDRIRSSLLALDRYNARFIVKMMISVRRLAHLERIKAAENYRRIMANCAKNGDVDHGIPF